MGASLDISEVDIKDWDKQIKFIECRYRPLNGRNSGSSFFEINSQAASNSESVQNAGLNHHFILIKLSDKQQYIAELVDNQYRIKKEDNITNESYSRRLTQHPLNYTITLKVFQERFMPKPKWWQFWLRYYKLWNNCIHFCNKVAKNIGCNYRVWNIADFIFGIILFLIGMTFWKYKLNILFKLVPTLAGAYLMIFEYAIKQFFNQ